MDGVILTPLKRIYNQEGDIFHGMNCHHNAIPSIGHQYISNLKYKPKNKSKKITKEDFMTETLAKVYLKQNKLNDALKAYKILSLKYPEKNSLFADQIKFIKNKLKNE